MIYRNGAGPVCSVERAGDNFSNYKSASPKFFSYLVDIAIKIITEGFSMRANAVSLAIIKRTFVDRSQLAFLERAFSHLPHDVKVAIVQ